MLRNVIPRYRGHRHVEMPADDFGDLPDRNTLVTDAMQPSPGRPPLHRQSEQLSGVQSVHRGPSIGPIAGKRRDALAARDVDEPRDEAVVAPAMHARRETHNGN